MHALKKVQTKVLNKNEVILHFAEIHCHYYPVIQSPHVQEHVHVIIDVIHYPYIIKPGRLS